jgi:REP element-mobilizing transposase RayT
LRCRRSVVLQKIKANSSRWMGDHGKNFAWQEGYGALSVGASQLEAVKEYIRNHSEHHKKHSFQEKFLALLRKYNIRFDRNEVFA